MRNRRLVNMALAFLYPAFGQAALARGPGTGQGLGCGFGGTMVFMGALTLALVAATVVTGTLKLKNRKRRIHWHKQLGTAALIVALLHGLMGLLR